MKLPTNYVWKEMTDFKLLLLYSNTWNHFSVCKKKKKMSSDSFKNVIPKICLQIMFDVYV